MSSRHSVAKTINKSHATCDAFVNFNSVFRRFLVFSTECEINSAKQKLRKIIGVTQLLQLRIMSALFRGAFKIVTNKIFLNSRIDTGLQILLRLTVTKPI